MLSNRALCNAACVVGRQTEYQMKSLYWTMGQNPPGAEGTEWSPTHSRKSGRKGEARATGVPTFVHTRGQQSLGDSKNVMFVSGGKDVLLSG